MFHGRGYSEKWIYTEVHGGNTEIHGVNYLIVNCLWFTVTPPGRQGGHVTLCNKKMHFRSGLMVSVFHGETVIPEHFRLSSFFMSARRLWPGFFVGAPRCAIPVLLFDRRLFS